MLYDERTVIEVLEELSSSSSSAPESEESEVESEMAKDEEESGEMQAETDDSCKENDLVSNHEGGGEEEEYPMSSLKICSVMTLSDQAGCSVDGGGYSSAISESGSSRNLNGSVEESGQVEVLKILREEIEKKDVIISRKDEEICCLRLEVQEKKNEIIKLKLQVQEMKDRELSDYLESRRKEEEEGPAKVADSVLEQMSPAEEHCQESLCQKGVPKATSKAKKKSDNSVVEEEEDAVGSGSIGFDFCRRSERIFLSTSLPVYAEGVPDQIAQESDLNGRTSSSSKKILQEETIEQSLQRQQEHGIDECRMEHGWFCVCGAQCTTKTGLQTHIRYFTIDKAFACAKCGKKFFGVSDLKYHMQTVHNLFYDKKNGCRDCGSTFETRKELIHHLKDAHNKGPLVAKRSQYAFNDGAMIVGPTPQKNPNVDRIIITSNHTFITDQIAAEALLSLNMEVERKMKATVEERSLVVDEVKHIPIQEGNAEMKDSGIPLLHGQIHNVEDCNVWLCLCGTQFSRERSLKDHILLKSGARSFKCQFCFETFPRKDYLKYHLKSVHKMEVTTRPSQFMKKDCSRSETTCATYSAEAATEVTRSPCKRRRTE